MTPIAAGLMACLFIAGCANKVGMDQQQWVDTVCGGLAATFGPVATPQGLDELPSTSARKTAMLAAIDQAETAARTARQQLDTLGEPPVARGATVRRQFLDLFDAVLVAVPQARRKVADIDVTSPDVDVRFVGTMPLPAPTAEWNALTNHPELRRYAETSAACHAARDELGDEIVH